MDLHTSGRDPSCYDLSRSGVIGETFGRGTTLNASSYLILSTVTASDGIGK